MNPVALKKDHKRKRLSVYLHIDLEMQKEYHPSNPFYPITKRAIYYGARAISKQLGTLTKQTNYSNLEKVYSIWICDKVGSKKLQNTVTSYKIKREDLVGTCTEPEGFHDLMTIIIIRLGTDTEKDKIFDYIDSVFRADIARMKRYSDVEWTEELETEANTMMTMEDYVSWRSEAKGEEKGRALGRAEGRVEGVDKMKSLMLALKKAGREEDAFRACQEEAFCNRLFEEFGLNEAETSPKMILS